MQTTSLGFDVAKFQSHLQKTGILRTNRFLVQLTPPPLLQKIGSAELLTMRATQASVPGVILDDTAVNTYGIGVEKQFPTNARFNENGISFVDDGSGTISKFFYTWLASIFSFAPQNSASRPAYRVAYKRDSAGNPTYTVDLSLSVLNEQRGIVLTYVMREAFPIAMHDIRVDWAQTNEPYVVYVPFKYTTWSLANVSLQPSLISTPIRQTQIRPGLGVPSLGPVQPDT